MTAGRPTTYTPEVLEHAEDYFDNFEPWYENPVSITHKDGRVEEKMERVANPPPSILDLHRYLKSKNLAVSRWSLYDWSEEGNARHIKEFAQVIKSGIARLYPEILQENAIMGKYAQPFAIFAAKNRMKWTDKQDLNVSGAITIQSTAVDEAL
jgi:16S rRNA C967 or C1407 C5-methylase (RsmB/RsmF family)